MLACKFNQQKGYSARLMTFFKVLLLMLMQVLEIEARKALY